MASSLTIIDKLDWEEMDFSKKTQLDIISLFTQITFTLEDM